MNDRIAYFTQLRARATPHWQAFYDSQIEAHSIPTAPAQAPRWRHPSEAAWAAVFTALGVVWRYEAIEPELSKDLGYIPDFWLSELSAWIEIKSGSPTPQDINKARRLLAATGERVYLLSGWPGRGRYKALLFTEAGEFVTQRPDWSSLALCTLFDVSFKELWAAFAEVKRGYRDGR